MKRTSDKFLKSIGTRKIFNSFGRGNSIIYFFLLPTFIFLGIYVFYPTIINFYYNFITWDGLSDTKVFVGFRNYIELFRDKFFWKSLLNNIYWIAAGALFQMPMGMLLAVLLQRKIKFNNIIRTFIFIPVVISAVAVAILWKLIFEQNFGLINSFFYFIHLENFALSWLGNPRIVIFSIIMVNNWQYTGFHMVLYLAGLSNIPVELYEAARIDGVNEINQFFKISLPLLKESLLISVILLVTGSIKTFDTIWAMTQGGPNHASEVLASYFFINAFKNHRLGYASVIASAIFLLSLGFSIFQIKISRVGEMR